MEAVHHIDVVAANRIERPGFVLSILEFTLLMFGERLA
jgi:hypothetical protein